MAEIAAEQSGEILRDQVAIVTGGGSGLGRAIGRALARNGASVVLVGRRSDVLASTADEIGPHAHIAVQDICRLAELPDLVSLVERIAGPPTILIHCAGNHLKRDVVGTTDEEFAAVLMTHVQASFALSRLVIPHMRRAGGGSILFIASMTSFIGMPLVAAYSAAKSAMLGLVRSMAVELGPDNIRVNAIAPGWVETDMLRTAFAGDPIREGRALARTPLGRFGDPDEIGEAALYLSSGRASFVTGVCLPVDGGGLIGY